MPALEHETNVDDRLLTVPEAAMLLRVSAPTVRRLARTGQLPSLRVGKQIRVERDELKHLRQPPRPVNAKGKGMGGKR